MNRRLEEQRLIGAVKTQQARVGHYDRAARNVVPGQTKEHMRNLASQERQVLRQCERALHNFQMENFTNG